MLFSTTTSLLIFVLLDLSVTDRGLLRRIPNIIVDSSVSPCSSVIFCITYFNALLSGAYTLRIVCLLGELTPLLLYEITCKSA